MMIRSILLLVATMSLICCGGDEQFSPWGPGGGKSEESADLQQTLAERLRTFQWSEDFPSLPTHGSSSLTIKETANGNDNEHELCVIDESQNLGGEKCLRGTLSSIWDVIRNVPREPIVNPVILDLTVRNFVGVATLPIVMSKATSTQVVSSFVRVDEPVANSACSDAVARSGQTAFRCVEMLAIAADGASQRFVYLLESTYGSVVGKWVFPTDPHALPTDIRFPNRM